MIALKGLVNNKMEVNKKRDSTESLYRKGFQSVMKFMICNKKEVAHVKQNV